MSTCVKNKQDFGEVKDAWTNLLAPQHHRTKHGMERSTMHCFIDFKKAFDSIHHETLWKILRHYGLPQKIVGLISVLYKSFECSVVQMDSTQTDYFPVKYRCTRRMHSITNTVQYNPRLHYEQTTQNARHGIQWTMFSQLEDLDYVDDIALLSTNARHLQQKANVLNENAKKLAFTLPEEDQSHALISHRTTSTDYYRW